MKSYEEIYSEVRTLVAESLNIPLETVKEESLIADLSADSIQLFELLLMFEKVYDTETAYEDVVKLHTVRDIVLYTKRIIYSVSV